MGAGYSPHREFIERGREGMHHVQYRVDACRRLDQPPAPLGYRPIWYKRWCADTTFAYLERSGDPLIVEFLEMPPGGSGHEAARVSLAAALRSLSRSARSSYATATHSMRAASSWLDEVFTADAYIDYRATGGIDGPYSRIRAVAATGGERLSAHVPSGGQYRRRLEGDRAQARTLCLNPVVSCRLPAGGRPVMFLAMWYRDRLLRTRAGLAHVRARAGRVHPA